MGWRSFFGGPRPAERPVWAGSAPTTDGLLTVVQKPTEATPHNLSGGRRPAVLSSQRAAIHTRVSVQSAQRNCNQGKQGQPRPASYGMDWTERLGGLTTRVEPVSSSIANQAVRLTGNATLGPFGCAALLGARDWLTASDEMPVPWQCCALRCAVLFCSAMLCDALDKSS